MLYKDFEKKLIQICRTISAKHTGKKNSYDNWGQVSKEIQKELDKHTHNKLMFCETNSCNYFRKIQYSIYFKTDVLYNGDRHFLRLCCVKITPEIDETSDTFRSFNINVIRFPVLISESEKELITPHPYLKRFVNKKIKMKDDINDIAEKFHEEIKREYDYKYFDFISLLTKTAQPVYLNHVFNNDFLSERFCSAITDCNFIIYSAYSKVIHLTDSEMKDLRKSINHLFLKKRIYSVKFEMFENGNKIKEEYFQALPMSQIKYYHTYMKDSFFEMVHTPACGTGLIRMTVTNVCTGRAKTVDDCFNY